MSIVLAYQFYLSRRYTPLCQKPTAASDMVGKIVALIVFLFILVVVYKQYERCLEGTGGIFSKICHLIT